MFVEVAIGDKIVKRVENTVTPQAANLLRDLLVNRGWPPNMMGFGLLDGDDQTNGNTKLGFEFNRNYTQRRAVYATGLPINTTAVKFQSFANPTQALLVVKEAGLFVGPYFNRQQISVVGGGTMVARAKFNPGLDLASFDYKFTWYIFVGS